MFTIELTLVEILTGTFNLIFVIISFIVGLKILSKYFEFEKRYYIYVGITWIGISTPWMHGALAFVLLYFNIILAEEIRFIIGYVFIPIITVLWLITFTDFMYQEKKKAIVGIYTIISLVCEILFFYFLFDPFPFNGLPDGINQLFLVGQVGQVLAEIIGNSLDKGLSRHLLITLGGIENHR